MPGPYLVATLAPRDAPRGACPPRGRWGGRRRWSSLDRRRRRTLFLGGRRFPAACRSVDAGDLQRHAGARRGRGVRVAEAATVIRAAFRAWSPTASRHCVSRNCGPRRPSFRRVANHRGRHRLARRLLVSVPLEVLRDGLSHIVRALRLATRLRPPRSPFECRACRRGVNGPHRLAVRIERGRTLGGHA